MSAIFGETMSLPQEKGPEVKLKVQGDEFYTTFETLDGYTAIYDPAIGLFTYAGLKDGGFVSSGVYISNPPPAGLRRHLKESVEVHTRKFKERYGKIKAPAIGGAMDIGEYNGLLDSDYIHKGSVKGLTVLVQFPDSKINVKPQDVSAMLNTEGYSNGGNFCSVRDYFLKLSCGKLDYSNDVVGPITLKHNKMYYHYTLFVEEALNAVAEMGVDLSKYDSQGRGVIDAVSFLYAGSAVPYGMLHPHNYYINLNYSDIRTNLYMLSNLGSSIEDLAIGTICHESGHMLGRFPDLYDYGDRDNDTGKSSGMGYYCLMAAGNGLNGGKTPAPISAYYRYLAGWYDNAVSLNTPGRYEAKHGDYGTVFVYKTDKENEFFLVENRFKDGLDGYIPSSGLAIYHCDKKGSNEWQNATPDRHYQCGLLQKDGNMDLEKGRNRGDESDLFDNVDGLAVSHDTTPSSRMWDDEESGLMISDISEPGEVITFTVGRITSPGVVKDEARPALKIPDYSKKGVTSAISLNDSGAISRIKIGIDITHTYIGDLWVELTAPSGKKVVLHENQGGSADNLVTVYDSQINTVLDDMIGESIQGKWELRVADQVKRDVGTLNKWSIEIER